MLQTVFVSLLSGNCSMIRNVIIFIVGSASILCSLRKSVTLKRVLMKIKQVMHAFNAYDTYQIRLSKSGIIAGRLLYSIGLILSSPYVDVVETFSNLVIFSLSFALMTTSGQYDTRPTNISSLFTHQYKETISLYCILMDECMRHYAADLMFSA